MTELSERQKQHLAKIQNRWDKLVTVPCMHDSCSECLGTGIKESGSPCIHMISCPCPKCTPQYVGEIHVSNYSYYV